MMANQQWLDERESRAWRNYLSAHAKLLARVNRQLQLDSKLSGADYEVLVNLSEAPDLRMRSFELITSMEWEKSRLSHHLTRMEQRGLIERVGCPTDARGAFIVLTEQGQAAIASAAPLHVVEVRQSFIDALSPAQLNSLADISAALLDHFDHLDRLDCGR